MIKSFNTILFLTFLLSQTWEPVHHKELINHQNDIINFSKIDSTAFIYTPQLRTTRALSHRIIGYLPYWQYSYYPALDYSLLTEINYFSAELNEQGNIINDHNWSNLELVSFAHEFNVKVKLCATLFGSASLTTLLENSIYRQNAINNLLELVQVMGADGVDIDFELLPASQRDNLVIFMQELSDAFHSELEEPIITMATPAVDWNDAWDYEMLAQITDGLFIMGYDYFYSGSTTAGPVSPLGGYYYDLQYTVNDYITKTNGQFDKLILGLPYYGYDWPVVSSIIHASTTGPATARVYADAESMANEYDKSWDESSNAPWFKYEDTTWRQCWYDDNESISIKYQFAKNNELAGVGMWALGYDANQTELWDALYDNFNTILQGDLNSDSLIDILDIMGLVYLILNSSYEEAADMNGDAVLTIVDIVILINIVLEIN